MSCSLLRLSLGYFSLPTNSILGNLVNMLGPLETNVPPLPKTHCRRSLNLELLKLLFFLFQEISPQFFSCNVTCCGGVAVITDFGRNAVS